MWETSAVGGRLSSGAFVGRAAELERLSAMLDALADRGAATTLVGGDAGIGKTRLIEEFCAHARARGALVAVGACTPAEGGGLPYGPVVGALRDAARQLRHRDADEVLGPVQRALGIPGPASVESDPDRVVAPVQELLKTRLFEALLSGVHALAERSALVLVFEDLQWADSASVEVIDFLTRNLGGAPVLLIATYRSDEVDRDRPLRRLLAELGRHSRVTELEIAGLDGGEMALMLAGIIGAEPDWALVDAVQARSGGNPFFAEELVAARHAKSLPPSLRNVLMMRIERLSRAARQVVVVAAAAGTSVHHRLLLQATRLDADQLDAALSEAAELHVLVVDPVERSFRFRHALLRDAVYDTLLPGERIRVHRALAEVLTSHPELGAAGPGHAAVELADHWWEAGDWPEAFTASAVAGEAARRLLAMPEAYAYFERALAAAGLVVADSGGPLDVGRAGLLDQAELLMKTADAAYLTGEIHRSVELLHQALEGLAAEADSRRLATCYTMLGRNAWAAGDSRLALQSLQRAAAVLPEEPSTELAAVLAEEARSLMLMAHYDEAERKCRDALAIARAVDARGEESHLLITAGVCVSERGDVDAGRWCGKAS
jgi:predicted ATPase